MADILEEEVWRLANVGRGQDVKTGRGGGNSRPLSLSPNARARLARIVARRPEVMVKITGRTRGVVHLKAHLDYVSRNGRLDVERADGTRIAGRDGMRALHDDWLQANAVMSRGRNDEQSVQSVSAILSMPPGNPPDRVQEAARSWARETFADRHDWIMARHDDKDHPHVHVTVRAVGSDGRRLTAGPKELQVWRERFARELRRHGIEAEATPRQARGQVRRANRTPVHKIEQRGAVPRVRALGAVREAAPQPRQARPWETAIERRQENIRRAYLDHAATLKDADEPDDRRLGRDIERFVAGLPVALARRPILADELRSVTERDQQSEPASEAPGQIGHEVPRPKPRHRR